MENVIHRLTLDLARPDGGACVAVQQGDSARTLVVSLAQSGRPYWISEGVTAVFYARKSDGVPLFNACTIEHNAVHYEFTGQTTNVVGPVECEIKLYGPEMELLTSAPFMLMVEDTVHQDGDVPDSSPEYTALTELVSKGTALLGTLEGLSEELIPIRDEVVRNARSAEEMALAAAGSANAAAQAAADAERLAGHAEDAARRAEEAASKPAVADLAGHSLTLATAAEDGDTGVQLYPEGTETGPVLTMYGKNADEPVILRNVAEPERDDDAVSKAYLEAQLAVLKADILYEPITITAISIQPNVAQMGDQIVNPVVSWSVSREPVEQTVDGVAVDAALREYVVQQSYTKYSLVQVRAVDERGAVATASASMNFYNAVYYTSHWAGGLPTDSDLIAMSQKLQSGLGLTINAEAGDGEYVLYACPKRLGTPEFWANGFQGGFRWLGIVAHYNAHGYREEYNVYISEAAALTATITVK